MEKAILGDNQFFGIDHLSNEQARIKELRFQNTSEIIRVLDAAHEVGIRALMCTTYARMGEVCAHFSSNPSRYQDWQFYPCMPYAHKYANAVTELGLAGALKQFTVNPKEQLLKGGTAVLQRDAFKMMQLLVDAELHPFKRVNTGVIFLQNAVTDLLIGLGMEAFLAEFSNYVRVKHDADAGFITMNLPLTVEKLESVGLTNPIVCASINKIGFRMTGGIDKNEEVLASGRSRNLAMQVLAAGALKPADALEYVCNLKGIESVVFGASSAKHIQENYELITSRLAHNS